MLKPLLLMLLFTLAQASMLVSLPLFLSKFPSERSSGPYFVLLITSLGFGLVYAILTAAYKVIRRPPAAQFRQYWLTYLGIGGFLALNGLITVYSSLPNRVTPILQTLLQTTTFIWGIPASKIWVVEKSKYTYCQWAPIFSMILVMWGVVISLIPTVADIVQGKGSLVNGTITIVWVFGFMVAQLPGAFSTVFQERFLRFRVQQGGDMFYDLIDMLFWSNMAQLLTALLLFWVDFIKGFGFSPNPKTFFSNLSFTWQCFLHEVDLEIYPMCKDTWWHGIIFIGAFISANTISAILAGESAVFTLIAQTLASPLSAIYFIVFPVPGRQRVQVEFIIPALALLLAAVVLWKLWEQREVRRIRIKEQIQKHSTERTPFIN